MLVLGCTVRVLGGRRLFSLVVTGRRGWALLVDFLGADRVLRFPRAPCSFQPRTKLV